MQNIILDSDSEEPPERCGENEYNLFLSLVRGYA